MGFFLFHREKGIITVGAVSKTETQPSRSGRACSAIFGAFTPLDMKLSNGASL